MSMLSGRLSTAVVEDGLEGKEEGGSGRLGMEERCQ